MKFHAFMYVTIGRRRELEQGMAGKNPVLYQRMLDEISVYARLCDEAGYAGIGIPEHHLQIEGFELGQDPGLMAMYMGMQTQRLRINQFGYVLPTHNPLRVAEHAATLDHMLGGRLNVAFVRGYQARWFENYVAVPGVKATGPWNRKNPCRRRGGLGRLPGACRDPGPGGSMDARLPLVLGHLVFALWPGPSTAAHR